jgi:hypothetical protein
VCARLGSLRRQGGEDVAQVVRDFRDFDAELHAALGLYWPQRLLRAQQGALAR